MLVLGLELVVDEVSEEAFAVGIGHHFAGIAFEGDEGRVSLLPLDVLEGTSVHETSAMLLHVLAFLGFDVELELLLQV